MAEIPEAGTITAEQAILLLLLENSGDLKRLEKDGAVAPMAPGRYWLKDLVQGFVRYTRKNADMTDTSSLSICFGLTGARIGQLAREGWFKQIERGRYNWKEACAGYIRFLRDEDRRSSRSSSDSRIKDAKARDIEIRTMQRLGRLVPLEVYEEMIDSICGSVRSEFAGMAATVTRDLNLRRMIEREVNARLHRIAELAMAHAIRLETGSSPADAVRANGAGPVGGSKQDVPSDSGSTGTA